MTEPMNQVSVTSPSTVGGRQMTHTMMSATARFTMKKLVTVRMCGFLKQSAAVRVTWCAYECGFLKQHVPGSMA